MNPRQLQGRIATMNIYPLTKICVNYMLMVELWLAGISRCLVRLLSQH